MADLPPEQAYHVSPGGPGLAGARWFSAIVDDTDLEEAWDLTAAALRLALVQSWLIAMDRADADDRDELAAAMAEGPPHPDWEDFSTWQLDKWRNGRFRRFVREGWGLLTLPELVGPDLELVRIAPGRDGAELKPGDAIVVQTLTVQLVGESWVVAGIGRSLPRPGWPPVEEKLVTESA
jgi:hypothetical protein